MATVLLPIIAGNLLPDICYQNEQSRLNDFAAHLQAQLSGESFYNYGDTKPDPEFNSFPWLRTTDMRWYRFSGDWITPYNYDQFTRAWFPGTLTDLQTWDGGDTNPASDRSGPAWVEDTDWPGRSPMHPGDIPGTTIPLKTLAIGENYGEGQHKLILTELPAQMPLKATLPGNRTNLEAGGPQWLAPLGSHGALLTTPPTEEANFVFVNTGGDQPHQTVHPVRGCYFVKWSGRQYRKV